LNVIGLLFTKFMDARVQQSNLTSPTVVDVLSVLVPLEVPPEEVPPEVELSVVEVPFVVVVPSVVDSDLVIAGHVPSLGRVKPTGSHCVL